MVLLLQKSLMTSQSHLSSNTRTLKILRMNKVKNQKKFMRKMIIKMMISKRNIRIAWTKKQNMLWKFSIWKSVSSSLVLSRISSVKFVKHWKTFKFCRQNQNLIPRKPSSINTKQASEKICSTRVWDRFRLSKITVLELLVHQFPWSSSRSFKLIFTDILQTIAWLKRDKSTKIRLLISITKRSGFRKNTWISLSKTSSQRRLTAWDSAFTWTMLCSYMRSNRTRKKLWDFWRRRSKKLCRTLKSGRKRTLRRLRCKWNSFKRISTSGRRR